MRLLDLFETNPIKSIQLIESISHPEDLLFDQGVDGARRAVDELSRLEKKSESINIKWDGCLHPDTILLTNSGERKILDIINDGLPCMVMGRNLDNNIDIMTEACNYQINNNNKSWIEIEMDNGEIIRLTEDHEVYISNIGWIEAKKLIAGMDILEYRK